MMKTILAAIAMIPMATFAATSAAAPVAGNISVGTLEVTGDSDLGFSTGSVETDPGGGSVDTSSYGLGATGLYYLYGQGQMAVGVGGTLNYGKASFEAGGQESSASSFLIGPAIGVDFAVQDKLSLFGVLAVGYASESTEAQETEIDIDPVTFQPITSTRNVKTDASGFGFGLSAGAKYFLTKNFSVNGSLGYDWTKLTVDAPGDPSTTTGAFGLNVGLSVYFPTK